MMFVVVPVSTKGVEGVLQLRSYLNTCVSNTDVFLLFQGEVRCGQKVCGEMLRPRVCSKVHEEATERPGLPDGDHPWDRSARVGHSQHPCGQPPPSLWDGFWDGARPGVVSIQPAQDTETLTDPERWTNKMLLSFWVLTKLIQGFAVWYICCTCYKNISLSH